MLHITTQLLCALAEILALHGNLPTEQRMIASEILQRDSSDPKSPFHGKTNAKRAKAELTKHASKRTTPWAKRLEKERSRRRDNNDKDRTSRDC